jgi:hypothetical protein
MKLQIQKNIKICLNEKYFSSLYANKAPTETSKFRIPQTIQK